MMEIGRLCVKLAGRDAGKKCVIIDNIDDTYVLIDGETRRKKCNIKHLEPLEQKIELQKDADHDMVVSEFSRLGIEIIGRKSREKTIRPMEQRLGQMKTKEPKKEKKAVEKKPKKAAKPLSESASAEPKEKKPAKKPVKKKQEEALADLE